AAIVKSDLELLSLLVVPSVALEAFDYWGKLAALVSGLHAYAKEKHLFELRGTDTQQLGQVLLLPKTGSAMLPDDHVAALCRPCEREGLKKAKAIGLLKKQGEGFPLDMAVDAEFFRYSSMGGSPGVELDSETYTVGPGQQRHWLLFYKKWPGARFG